MLLGISIFLVGLSLCLFIYVLLSPGLKDTSETETIYFTKLAWVWPWVTALSNLIMPFLSWKFQKNVAKQIEQAGYKGYIHVKDIAGLQALGGIVVIVIATLTLNSFLDNWWLKVLLIIWSAFIGVYLPLGFLKKKIQERLKDIHKSFPFFLDMITLCVEAGSNLQMALMIASETLSDSPLRFELRYALNEMRTGVNRLEALKAMAERCNSPAVKLWVGSVVQAETLGSSLGTTLRAQADQFRQERFLRAEKKAAEAPVRLLLPLVLFIFPCTFIVIGYPILLRISYIGFF